MGERLVAAVAEGVIAAESGVGLPAQQGAGHCREVAAGPDLGVHALGRRVVQHLAHRPQRGEQLAPDIEPDGPLLLPGGGDGGLPGGEQCPGRPEEPGAGRGESDRARTALEQGGTEALLQPGDALGEGLLAQ